MKKLLTISIFLLLAGCDNGTLETGYTPRKLTDSPAVRQSYYAAPFSPEATQAGPSGIDGGQRGPTRY